MYQLSGSLPQDPEPWKISLGNRIKVLRDYLEQGEKVSIFLYRSPDTSTFRYRCYNISQIMDNQQGWKFVYFFINELDALEPYWNLVDCVTITRIEWTHKIDSTISQIKASGIPVLYNVDDLIFDLNMLPLIMNNLNIPETDNDYKNWFAQIARQHITASRADGFITTNSYLGEHLTSLYRKPFAVVPNFLNREQLDVSTYYRKQKLGAQSNRPFTLGYFSGTPTHINDFGVICGEILGLLDKFPDMYLHLVGFMQLPAGAQRFIDNEQIRITPLVDFLELQRLIAEVDVNLIPLVVSPFANCKSELKYFEASIVDTISIATPTFTLDKAISNGDTGFLAQTGEWAEIIEALYSNEINQDLIIKNSRNQVVQDYSGKTIIDTINTSFETVLQELSGQN